MKATLLPIVPNLISGARLAAMPVLLTFAVQGRHRAFAWLLLAGLLSDIVDGLVARRFHLQSGLGSALDSAADLALSIVTAIGVILLQRSFVAGHAAELLVLMTLWIGEVALAFARYGRFSSFHTYTTRLTAYLQGSFVLSLFFWGYAPVLFYAAWAIGCISYLEECVLLAVLPEWTHDVRGLYWVMKAQRSS